MTNNEHRQEAEQLLVAVRDSLHDGPADRSDLVFAVMALTHAVLSLAQYDTRTVVRP